MLINESKFSDATPEWDSNVFLCYALILGEEIWKQNLSLLKIGLQRIDIA